MKESGSAVFIVRLFTKALKSQFFSKVKFISSKTPFCRQTVSNQWIAWILHSTLHEHLIGGILKQNCLEVILRFLRCLGECFPDCISALSEAHCIEIHFLGLWTFQLKRIHEPSLLVNLWEESWIIGLTGLNLDWAVCWDEFWLNPKNTLPFILQTCRVFFVLFWLFCSIKLF